MRGNVVVVENSNLKHAVVGTETQIGNRQDGCKLKKR